MYSFHNDIIPIITFVGRPLDPAKGLATLLDALELLLSLPNPPRFSVWVVGGDADELPHVRRLVLAHPRLHHEFKEGRITIWGKFARLALPEIYRRSHVVVMPSFREPFGLVAVEAMACGCPVIGTRQGGIGDTVQAGITGATVEVDHPEALAGAVLLYLRNPVLREVRGKLARQWAVSAFSKADAYGRIARLYTDPPPAPLGEPDWDLRARFSEATIEALLPAVENAIGRRISRSNVIADRYHLVARIDTDRGPLALKIFRDRPSLAAAVLPVGRPFFGRTAGDFVDNTLFHRTNSLVPSLLAADRKAGYAVFAWNDDELAAPSYPDLRPLIEGFFSYGEAPLSAVDTAGYRTALEIFLRSGDENTLAALDDEAAALNRRAQGIDFGLRANHPVAELHRILMSADLAGWPLPTSVVDRIRTAVLLILQHPAGRGAHPDVPLRLCHGDLKGRHVLVSEHGLSTLDTEHSVYAAGERDLGTFAADQLHHGVNAASVIAGIRRCTDGDGAALTALQWTLCFLVYGYLTRVHHGKITESTRRLRRTLSDFILALG